MEKIKPNYLIIPGITIVVSSLGKIFSSSGMPWYRTLSLPTLTPSSLFITLMWQLIFVLTTFAVLLVWNTFDRNAKFWVIISCFSINAVLNVAWSYIFFYHHMIGVAVIDAIMLTLTVLMLVLLLWPLSKLTSGLLLPYLFWTTFATFLNILIWMMN